MSKLKFILKRRRAVTLSLLMLLLLGAVSLPLPGVAQTRPVIVATGYEFNLFADPTIVPEFNGTGPVGAYAGPTAMAFDARGRLFIGTYSGKILILLDTNDDGRADEIRTFASGIPIPLGLTFRANGDLYITSNQLPQFGGQGRIMRLRDTNGDDIADEETIIIDDLPSQGDHQTNRLRFGPDGLLYFGQGSATDNGTPKPGRPAEAPLNSTMLRANVDAANPTVEVVATGLRNPFGMAFHPVNGELFATDGGSGEICQSLNCPPEDVSPMEEINWVVQGGNYGFPQCEGTPDGRFGCANVRPPVQQFGQHLTPTSLTFYTGPQAGEELHQLFVTLYKRFRGQGGNLQLLKLEGSKETGFFVSAIQVVADFGIIDPGDGPIDTAIDPISGDIYVARFDPVQHADPNEHHHFIYRIHRAGSDAQPFIGNLQPASVQAGAGARTLNLNGRHVQPGAVLFADGVALTTRQGATRFDVVADLPANMTASARTLLVQLRNPDATLSNLLSLRVTAGEEPPPPPPGETPQITSFFTYKKKPAKVVTLLAGMNPKKFFLVIRGTNFGTGAQLLVNGTPLELINASATELTGRFANPMLATPGNLSVQVRAADGKVSNTVQVAVNAQ